MIKAYTDINQSKMLAEILPLESADMWWLYITSQGKYIAMMHEEPDPHYLARMASYGIKDAAIPCWSLAALLNLLPECLLYTPNPGYEGYACLSIESRYETFSDDNPVDCCVEMIIELHNKGLL